MIISEEMVSVYLDLKKHHGWGDPFFINLLSICNVPRKIISQYYDLCVVRKEMKSLEESENINEIRERVMKTTLSKADKLELGKCINFINQLNVNV